jgi:hypothetical protein
MEFEKVTTAVKKKLDEMSLSQKVLLFKQLFNFPIDYKDNVYYYGTHEWDENRMKDFLTINTHWMSVREFDRMYHYFEKNNIL